MLNFEVGKTYRKTNSLHQRTWKCIAIEGKIAVLCDPVNPICVQTIRTDQTDYWQEFTEPTIHTGRVALFGYKLNRSLPPYWYDDTRNLSSSVYIQLTDWVDVKAKEKII